MRLFKSTPGYARQEKMEKLSFSPLTLRHDLMALIDSEIAHAQAGRPAAIWAKMNSIVDPAVIDALYRASNAGVSIDLLIPCICCPRPRPKALPATIRCTTTS